MYLPLPVWHRVGWGKVWGGVGLKLGRKLKVEPLRDGRWSKLIRGQGQGHRKARLSFSYTFYYTPGTRPNGQHTVNTRSTHGQHTVNIRSTRRSTRRQNVAKHIGFITLSATCTLLPTPFHSILFFKYKLTFLEAQNCKSVRKAAVFLRFWLHVDRMLTVC